MTGRKPITPEEELTEAFDKLFFEIPSPQTQEEIDEYIREAGIDLDGFGVNIREIASKALSESLLNWRAQATKTEIGMARKKLDDIRRIGNVDRNNLLSIIEKAITNIQAANPQFAPVHYRNHAESPDADLISLLQELIFIADQSNIKIDLGE